MFQILFWVSVGIIFFSYLGYGLLLLIIIKIFNLKKKPFVEFTPHLTLIVAAYNEEAFIEEKIVNSLSLAYPKEKLDFIFITDGSTDDTASIIKKYPQIKLLHQNQRQGKTAALNRAIQFVQSPFIVFTDANTLLNKNCLLNISRHYADKKIGGVAGEKKIITNSIKSSAAESGEGIYWKYESYLKKLDAQFYTVVGAAGELFSIKTDLFEPLEENILLDDFIISLRVCEKGYKVAYEPDAYATETSSASMKEEQKRKIRISAGGFQAIGKLKKLLNPFFNFKLFFQYFSHRFLRWAVCPFLLPVAFIANAWLAFSSSEVLYVAFFVAQIVFYTMAAIGWAFANKNIKIKILYIPYYFVFMNAALYLGLVKYLKGNQSVLWDKAARKTLA